MNRFSDKGTLIKNSLFIVLVLIGSYYLSYINYTLFHLVYETACIIIGCSIFIITKNTHKVSQNNYFIFLGICFVIASIFDFMHLITYDGMNLISAVSRDVTIQFRIVARWIQAFSFLVFCLLINRENKPVKLTNLLRICYALSIMMFVSIFNLRIFPKVYTVYGRWASFKYISEIFICLTFMLVVLVLYKNKKKIHENISLFLISSIGILTASELCFIFYKYYGDFIGITGHILKLISYYLLYKAIVQTTLENPYNVLFYKLTEINSSLEIKTRLLMKINQKLNGEINERKAVEEKLRESKRRYQELLDFLPYAIITHCEEKIVYLNNAALSLFKLENYKDALDKDILEFIHPDYRAVSRRRIQDVYNSIEGDIDEIKVISSDGDEIFVETKAVPYVFKDKPAGLVVLGDISERKKAEEKDKALKEAIEYDRIKNEFMANISHELRTPLNVIFGAVQLIEYYSESNSVLENKANISKYSKSMRQNCYRMLRLVNNLIDLTKLDSGFLKLNLCNHNIINIVEDITLSVAQYIESKDLKIEFDTEVEEKHLACDADMIERIMLNLLSNAVKFTPAGGKVAVNIYDRGEFILISVKDTGIGIPEDKLELIFDRFRQVDKSLTRNTEGSGIGLNLVKSLVELHGGEISVESIYGEGSEFIVELPSRTVAYDEVAATLDIPHGKVERIHIEFSDIYS
ncbi:ATP-binding protein [Clostridium swellfunianum]|uniref:sensor histidine kinase n=1 Tax=Clostridium swellfunianum TaxID=1367462 RepID=UPI002030A7A0|nr:MASE3 domain-containing protein [Clostridium swellfunianum]MCM0647791.1 ATP-binding protein [Clostridium swellfunianum]